MSDIDDQDDVEATLGDLIVASIEKSGGLDFNRLAERILAAGWRPPARVIETYEELNALLNGAVVRDDYGTVFERCPGQGMWFMTGDEMPQGVALPVTLLWEPGDDDE